MQMCERMTGRRITVNFPEDSHALAIIEDIKDEDDVDSWSEAVRVAAQRYEDLHTENEELRNQCEDLRTDVERLKNEKQTILAERDEKKKLARFAEDEQMQREKRRMAPAWVRAKWWLFGQDD